MKPVDFAKAIGVAVAILVLNLLIATLVIVAYSLLIEPGRSSEFYQQAALRIAPWCSHTFGTALFLAAGYVFTRRKPDRNGVLFTGLYWLLYVFMDAAVVGFAGIFNIEFALSMLAKLAAGLAGVYLATRFTPASES